MGTRLRGEDVVATCNALAARRGAPKRAFVDNGSEFSGRMFDLWAYHHGVQIDFSRPGKPTDNAFVESFNGSQRDECLNANWFESIDDAKAKIEAWRVDYNESRPHQALGEQTPNEFAARANELREEVVLQAAGNQLSSWSEERQRINEKPSSRNLWSEEARQVRTACCSACA